jgi:hypothetical protein
VFGKDSVTSATTSESAHAKFESAQAATSKSEHRQSTRAAERWAYEWVDRRLKVLSVLLPVSFILALAGVSGLSDCERPG